MSAADATLVGRRKVMRSLLERAAADAVKIGYALRACLDEIDTASPDEADLDSLRLVYERLGAAADALGLDY